MRTDTFLIFPDRNDGPSEDDFKGAKTPRAMSVLIETHYFSAYVVCEI